MTAWCYKVVAGLLLLYFLVLSSLSKKRGFDKEIKELKKIQEDQQKLISELQHSLHKALDVNKVDSRCKDNHIECESWSTCCPNGTGETTCSTLDCENDFDTCSGSWMKKECTRTCGLCADQTPLFEKQKPILAPWDRLGPDHGTLSGYDGVTWHKWHAKSPRVVYIKNCLRQEHYEEIKKLAEPHLKRSKVVHPVNSSETTDQVRTSQGMWLQGNEFDCVGKTRLLDIISTVSGYGESHFEAVQILKYNPGEYYIHHSDWFESNMKAYLGTAGQRIATSITFLNTIPMDQGGNTVFSYSTPKVNVTPVAGDSIIFYNMHLSGRPDKASEHEAVPPQPGYEKWVAIIWIRVNEFST